MSEIRVSLIVRFDEVAFTFCELLHNHIIVIFHHQLSIYISMIRNSTFIVEKFKFN